MRTCSPASSRDGPHELVLEARQVAAVDRRLRGPGDDVRLVAGGQLGRVGGVAQRGADELRRRAERGHEPVDGLGVLRVERQAGELGDALEQRVDRGGQLQRPRVAAEPCHRLGQVRHRVVGVDLAPVPRATVGDEAHPRQALLGGLQQVRAATVDVDREAADLTDRLGGALEQLRAVVDRPARAEAAAGLLVREHRDDDVPGRLAPLAGHLPDDGQDHRVHVLHVHGAAAPDQAVDLLGAERVHGPVLGPRRHDVEVTVQHERGPRRVLALEPHDDAGPAGGALEQLGVEPDLGEQAHDVLGGRALPRPGVVAVVRRVDADEVAADLHDLVLGGERKRACRRPGG